MFKMVFNTYYAWSTDGAAGTFDTQSVATHELGHALGLRDLYGNAGTPNDSAKIMYNNASTIPKRKLDYSDLAGIYWIYSGITPPTPPATIAYNPAS